MALRLPVTMILLAACAPAPPPPAAPPVVLAPAPVDSGPVLGQPLAPAPEMPAAPSASTLTGTLGGRAFAAKSALLVRVNEEATAGSSVHPGQRFDLVTSYLVIFERKLDCADLGGNRRPRVAKGDELLVEVELHGIWPWPARRVTLGFDPARPAANGAAANVWGGSSGNILSGTLQVSTNDGRERIELDASTRAVDPATRGSVQGYVVPTVCPWPRSNR